MLSSGAAMAIAKLPTDSTAAETAHSCQRLHTKVLKQGKAKGSNGNNLIARYPGVPQKKETSLD